MFDSSLVLEVKEKQYNDPILLQLKNKVCNQRVMAFEQGGDGILRYENVLCVPMLKGFERGLCQKRTTPCILFIRASQRCTMT
uniref:Gag-pol polyprotein n=1 Tax=Solanum tuberosum TaxID=4113 RepID=M1AKS4_SOLTU